MLKKEHTVLDKVFEEVNNTSSKVVNFSIFKIGIWKCTGKDGEQSFNNTVISSIRFIIPDDVNALQNKFFFT